MIFSVLNRCDIVCDGCGAYTRVDVGKVYDTETDMMCNCEANKRPQLFANPDMLEIHEKEEHKKKYPFHNSKVAKAALKENDNQAKMFGDKPVGVIEPEALEDDDMDEAAVRVYLDDLIWQDLLQSAKNNGVVKPRACNREQLVQMIIDKVFNTVEGEDNG